MRTCRRHLFLKDKIKNISELSGIVAGLKKKKQKIVFTNGCFDILHYGHVQYLEDAKNEGDILIVGINSDSSIRRIKGEKRPVINQADRSKIIAGLSSVDYVVIFSEDTPLEVIKAIKPNVLAKGADWQKNKIIGADLVEGYGGKVQMIKLLRNRSTTDIINKIVKTF